MLGSISRRYARALLEVAAPSEEAGSAGRRAEAEGRSIQPSAADAVGAELASLAGALAASAELREVLGNPAFDQPQRLRVVEALIARLGLGASVGNLARLLVDRDRFGDLPAIAESYRELADEHAGRARATVRVAAPLANGTAGFGPRLEQALSKAVSRQVTLEVRVDPSLIGGAVAQVGSLSFDGSVKTELEKLRRRLKGS